MDVDLSIINGRVADGTGNPWYWGELGIRSDRICWVGRGRSLKARRTIDARGMIVCPGFIDVHTHSDIMPLVDPRHSAKVMQGVTTDVIGQDGLSYAPLTDQTLEYFRTTLKAANGAPQGLAWDWRSVSEYLERFDGHTAINFAMLAPHGNIRAAVLGLESRAPKAEELAEMCSLLDRAMRQGTFGLSTGLTYAPCSYASTHELVELCRVAGRYGGYFAPHLRSYGAEMEAAVREAIEVCTEAGLPLHLTHFRAPLYSEAGQGDTYLEWVDRARSEGLEVTMDMYPYLAGATFLAGLLPGWSHEGGNDNVIRRLTDPQTRNKIRHELEVTGSDGMHNLPARWDSIVLTDVESRKNAEFIGLNLQEISQRLGKTPFDCFADLLIEERFAASCVVFAGNEENLQRFMRHPTLMAGSDGLLIGRRPHPRAWGTFARYLSTYVRELGILSLADCIRKMTSLPAQRLGLQDRGIIRTGMLADLVVFDPDTVRDTATYEEPRSHPLGIPFVIVNGQLVKDDGQQSDALPGRALKNPRA